MNARDLLMGLIPAAAIGLFLAIVPAWRRCRRESLRQAAMKQPPQVDPGIALITSLGRLSNCMRVSNPGWAGKLNEAASRARSILGSATSAQNKYEFARSIEGFFGAMGSLNDNTPTECRGELHELWSDVQTVLRICWQRLGKEHHDYSMFQVLEKGTEVKLVPGKVRYYEKDGRPVHIVTAEALEGRSWVVDALYGPDITNMPEYLIRCGDKFMVARHEALLLMKNNGEKTAGGVGP